MWGMVALPQFLLNNQTPVSLFRSFFTEEIFNLIPNQTNIYGKGKKQSRNQSMERYEQKRDWIISSIGYSNGYQPLDK